MRAYRRLFRYASPHWRRWIGVIIITLVGTVFTLLQPWPTKILVDDVLGDVAFSPGTEALLVWLPGARTRSGLLAWVVFSTVVIFAVTSAANVLLTLEWTRLGRVAVNDLARDLFARLQRRSLIFHSRHAVGDSMSRITDDAWCVHTVLDTLLFAPGHALLTLLAMVAVMVRLDPWLTLLSLAVAPFMAASAALFGRPIRAAARHRREIESRLQAHVQQTLTGIPVVQAFTREDVEHARFRQYAAEAIRAHQRSAFVESAYGLGSGLVTTLGTAAVLWVASTRVLDGRLSVGSTLVFLSYLASLQSHLATFAGVYTALQGAGASTDRVMEVLDTDEGVAERPRARALPPVRGHVRIEGVTFAYEPGHQVLRNVTVDARPGETVAIVGHTGAGKTTLVSLVPRFFDPDAGRVLVDGHDVREVSLQSLRDQIAIVLQEPFLFPISIAENIRYGRPSATRSEVESAARAANAHRFIERTPEGYDTVLGEHGATLSGGERQRLAIARALLKNAPILIMDEPTSALDAETEWFLLEALDRLMRGRTTFVIAHRLSTVRRATRIVVLDHGIVVEQGTHDELLSLGGQYSRLYRLQFQTEVAPLPGPDDGRTADRAD